MKHGSRGVWFDRRVSAVLLDALLEGFASPLMALVHGNRRRVDLQLRFDVKSRVSKASVYAGLTAIVHLEEHHGLFRLGAAGTHRSSGGFDDAWVAWQPAPALAAVWPAVMAYLEVMLEDGSISGQWTAREGRVLASLASGRSQAFRLIQREAQPAFTSAPVRDQICAPLRARLSDALAAEVDAPAWWPRPAPGGSLSFGLKADAVAVDPAGRLLVIEAKAGDALSGIAAAAAQVGLYAALFAAIVEDHNGVDALNGMLDQRVQLGLTDPGAGLEARPRVVPVVAIGPGVGQQALDRLSRVARTLPAAPAGIDPLEVWVLDDTGDPVMRWCPILEDRMPALDEAVAPGASFVAEARAAAVTWKLSTTTLPDEARAAGRYRASGPYPFCLPADLASLNLLPDARAVGIDRFSHAGIAWHQGCDGGPTNHLLSSQIQCVNALAPFVADPAALATVFGGLLDIAEVIPFAAGVDGVASDHDRGDHVVFEWVGLADHLNEHPGSAGTRGAHNTSVDAAIRYRTTSGRVEVALIEWKYTETYRGDSLAGGAAKNHTRRCRYQALYDDPDGPIRNDLLDFDDFLVEPIYQLFRQQLLAWRMEQAHELDADIVRLIYASPAANTALHRSLHRPGHLALTDGAPHVEAFWSKLLRRPDRFLVFDTAALVEPGAPTSTEFKARYGHLLAPTATTRTLEQTP